MEYFVFMERGMDGTNDLVCVASRLLYYGSPAPLAILVYAIAYRIGLCCFLVGRVTIQLASGVAVADPAASIHCIVCGEDSEVRRLILRVDTEQYPLG